MMTRANPRMISPARSSMSRRSPRPIIFRRVFTAPDTIPDTDKPPTPGMFMPAVLVPVGRFASANVVGDRYLRYAPVLKVTHGFQFFPLFDILIADLTFAIGSNVDSPPCTELICHSPRSTEPS